MNTIFGSLIQTKSFMKGTQNVQFQQRQGVGLCHLQCKHFHLMTLCFWPLQFFSSSDAAIQEYIFFTLSTFPDSILMVIVNHPWSICQEFQEIKD